MTSQFGQCLPQCLNLFINLSPFFEKINKTPTTPPIPFFITTSSGLFWRAQNQI